MHLGTGERKWSSSEYPVSQSQVHWKINPNRKLPQRFIFYFHQSLLIRRKDWWKRRIIMWDEVLRQALCTVFHAFKFWAGIAFTATRLGLQLVANVMIQRAVVHLNGEISWISFSRVSCLAGTALELLPMVGIASQHRSTWGALSGSPGVSAVLNRTASSLFIDCLKSCSLQLTVLTQAISF